MKPRESTRNALQAIRFIERLADKWEHLIQDAAALAESPNWRRDRLDLFDIGNQDADDIGKFWLLALEEQCIRTLTANTVLLEKSASAWKKVPPIDLFALYRAWTESPVVLEFDEELACQLESSDIGADVNLSEFLGRLPFSAFFVSADHLGFRLTNASERLTRGLGFFVATVWMPRVDQPHRVEKHLMVVPVDENRKMAPLVIPLRFRTPKELIDDIAETHARANGSEGRMMRQHVEEDVRTILCLLLYLASEERDVIDRVTRLPFGANDARGDEKDDPTCDRPTPTEPRELIVGSMVGPAVTSKHRDHGAGRVLAPHIRRAHFHTYITGSRSTGETRRVIRWVAQTAVNMNDADDPVMVRVVK